MSALSMTQVRSEIWAHGPGTMGQGPWARAHGALPWALAQSPITNHARIILGKGNFVFEEIPDLMKTKQSRSDITSRYQPVAYLDLCYVSENGGKRYLTPTTAGGSQ